MTTPPQMTRAERKKLRQQQIKQRDAAIAKRMDAGENPADILAALADQALPMRQSFSENSVRSIYRSHLQAVANASDFWLTGCHCGQHWRSADRLKKSFDRGVLYFLSQALQSGNGPRSHLRAWLKANYEPAKATHQRRHAAAGNECPILNCRWWSAQDKKFRASIGRPPAVKPPADQSRPKAAAPTTAT